MRNKTPKQIEHEIMVHRYLYYIEAEPVISDFEYDMLERKAREILPDSSPVQGIGSSLFSSYSSDVIKDALSRIKQIRGEHV